MADNAADEAQGFKERVGARVKVLSPVTDTKVLPPTDARKTYRYLRAGMIGAVVLLAASILIERSKVDCWQTSISAYYYTPVRAVFVGAMIAVGLALIVYKGRGLFEDSFLNFAGMLAPLVAVAPTTDVGECWSIEPDPVPVTGGALEPWVIANIDNNVNALLIAGFVGLIAAVLIGFIVKRSVRAPIEWDRGTSISLLVTFVALVVGWSLLNNWDDFDTRAHGFAAFGMFGFLILAIISKVIQKRLQRDTLWFWLYAAVATLMILGAAVILATRVFGEHTVFALETFEITLFAVYWLGQTAENWDEVVPPETSSNSAGAV